MSDLIEVRDGTFEIEGPRPDSLEARASVVLRILAAAGVAGIVLALFPSTIPVATLHTVAFNVAAAFLVGVYLLVAYGLNRRRRWAVGAARPLLLVVGVAGWYVAAVAASEGITRIPFEGLLAVWVLLGSADIRPVARPGLRSALLVGGAAALLVSMQAGHQLFGWGGAFDVKPTDLRATLSVDCGDASGPPPDRISLTYEWSWDGSMPMASGTDILVVGWTGDDAAGRPLYVFDAAPDTDAGIYPGLEGVPSARMARAIAEETDASWRWAIRLDERALAAGRVELNLRRARDAAPGSQPLRISAAYVHVGVWRGDAPGVTCAWSGGG